MTELEITGLTTLQFGWGGLFDWKPSDGYQIHLVRSTKRGHPGPTLCGIDRFTKDGPGWSCGGGLSGGDIVLIPCEGCAGVAGADFPGLPINGTGSKIIASHIAELSAVPQ